MGPFTIPFGNQTKREITIKTLPLIAAIILLFLLGARIYETTAASHAIEVCSQRVMVARALAEQHQYGGDVQGYISQLSKQGASEADIAAYKRFAEKLERFPRLAGDGGRQKG